jgi:hypothetical protein
MYPTTAELSERTRAVESLQQLQESVTTAAIKDRLELYQRTLNALHSLLYGGVVPAPSDDDAAATAFRGAAFQFLAKVQLAAVVPTQDGTSSTDHFSVLQQIISAYFDICFKAISTGSEENALKCVKCLSSWFRTVRQIMAHVPDGNISFRTMLEECVDSFIEVCSDFILHSSKRNSGSNSSASTVPSPLPTSPYCW